MSDFMEIISNQVNNRIEHMKSKVPSCMLDFYNALKPYKKGNIWFRVGNDEVSLAVCYMNIFYNYDAKKYSIVITNEIDPKTNELFRLAEIEDFCEVVNFVLDRFYIHL